ncbi:DUF2726 domain-containing protein [Aquabacterium sp.]|uniref:DUF2726 domain-containing protein n=1 Tax=Aquabacterium sp. TaxID=1872578 RepID=UPI0035B2508E
MRLDPILLGTAGVAVLVGWLLHVIWMALKRRRAAIWPHQWHLNARPVFTTEERALFRALQAALPNHVILAKLNVMRFCQPAQGFDARRWYDRLQTLNVSFAICTINGTVMSVIDLESRHKPQSSRSQRMKETVLESARVRYLRCQSGQWPQGALLAPWVLGQNHIASPEPSVLPSQPATPISNAGNEIARKLKARRAERAARWAESSFAQDSFFSMDSRFDGVNLSEPMPLESEQAVSHKKTA